MNYLAFFVLSYFERNVTGAQFYVNHIPIAQVMQARVTKPLKVHQENETKVVTALDDSKGVFTLESLSLLLSMVQ